MLSSCPVDLPRRLGPLKSGRVLRPLSALAAVAVLAVVLYNAVMVDRIPPTYTIAVSSTTGGGLALTLTSVDVNFSEDVRPTTAQNAFSTTPHVDGTFHWQGLKMIFTPSAKLPLSTKFHVHIAPGVQDIAGNSQSGTGDLDFTTVGPPAVASVSPATGADSIAVDASIQITFDRLMDTKNVLKGLTLEPDIAYEASWNGDILTLNPTRPLQYGTTYTVKIGDPAVDTDGTQLPPYATNFKTVGMGLKVTALVPAPNVAGVSIHSQIAITFDTPIDPASVAGAITITPPVAGSTTAISLPDDRSPSNSATATSAGFGADVLVFTPDNPLAAHTTYAVTMSSTVRRTDGQVASAQNWSFTTGEPQANALNQIAFISDRGGIDNVWVMNPDGSNQREVTAELVPVSGFDVSGDGNTIAYAAGGVVKRMAIDGDNVHVLTAAGAFDYAPEFTPDGTAIVVGRRDPTGADQGYWRIPIVSGVDPRQVSPDGAPGLGSVALHGDELTGSPGETSWAPRAAFSADGNAMLLVRGNDNAVELVDMTGVNPPQVLGLTGNSRPIWDPQDNAFYVVASTDRGATWYCFQVTTGGATTRVGAAAGDLTVAVNGNVAFAVQIADGSAHLVFASSGSSATSSALTSDPTWSDGSPSFSPDGSLIVFGRFGPPSPTVSGPAVSGGIWVIGINGSGLTQLATDGAYPLWLP